MSAQGEQGEREDRAEHGQPEEPASEIDAVGQRCPLPVIALARHIADVPVGALVVVVADDEAAGLDIPAWCRMRGQDYVGERPRPVGTAYVVRRLR